MKANLAMMFATVVEPVFDVFKKKTRFVGLHERPAMSVFVSEIPTETSGLEEGVPGLADEVLFMAEILLIK